MFRRTILVFDFILLISCFPGYLLAATCDFKVTVRQNLREKGFHRNLTYGIVFNAEGEREKWLYQDCAVGLEQPLPAGVFANPDEIEDLSRNQRINAVVKNKINIEMPAEDSEPSIVYMSGEIIGNKVYMWLPVHARYHRAKKGGGHVTNEISAPRVYLRCPERRLACGAGPASPAASFLCNGSSRDKCSWQLIPHIMLTDPIIWEIPVGNTDDYYLVATGTTVSIVCGSLFILWTIHQYKIRDGTKKS